MLMTSSQKLNSSRQEGKCQSHLYFLKFKADCKILFDGPLSNLKDKQCAGLIVNWLGREATQILMSCPDLIFDYAKVVSKIVF